MAHQPLKKLGPVHMAAISLLMKGQTNTQIAEELGKNSTTISEWRHDPLVQEEIRRRVGAVADELRSRLAAAASNAMTVVEISVDLDHPRHSEPSARAIRSAHAVLDRAGVQGLPAQAEAEAPMTHEEAVEAFSDVPSAVLADAYRRALQKEQQEEAEA